MKYNKLITILIIPIFVAVIAIELLPRLVEVTRTISVSPLAATPLDYSDLFDRTGVDAQSYSKDINGHPVLEKPEDLVAVEEGTSVENDGFKTTVVASTASKERGDLNWIKPEYYPRNIDKPPYILDQDNNFLDDNLYLIVTVIIENIESESIEQPLANFRLKHCSTGTQNNSMKNGFVDIEMTLSNFTKNALTHDNNHVSIAAGERITCVLGYVLSEEEYVSLKDNLYIIPDYYGSTMAYAPGSIKRIHLSPVDR